MTELEQVKNEGRPCQNGEYLAKYRQRARTSERNALHNVLHISAKYSEKMEKSKLKQRASILLDNLRAELGCSFLENVRLFVTHPVQKNLFMSSYAMNFLPQQSVGHTWRGGMR